MLTAVQALADAGLYVTPRTDDPSDGYFIDAVNVLQEAFDGIAERRRHRVEHRWELNRWERALQSQFLRLQHHVDPTVILRLRRDMQETILCIWSRRSGQVSTRRGCEQGGGANAVHSWRCSELPRGAVA